MLKGNLLDAKLRSVPTSKTYIISHQNSGQLIHMWLHFHKSFEINLDRGWYQEKSSVGITCNDFGILDTLLLEIYIVLLNVWNER